KIKIIQEYAKQLREEHMRAGVETPKPINAKSGPPPIELQEKPEKPVELQQLAVVEKKEPLQVPIDTLEEILRPLYETHKEHLQNPHDELEKILNPPYEKDSDQPRPMSKSDELIKEADALIKDLKTIKEPVGKETDDLIKEADALIEYL